MPIQDLALTLNATRYLSPARPPICLLPHGDMVPERNTLVTLANSRFSLPRELVECHRPRCSRALQTSGSARRLGCEHHFPRSRTFIVRQFGAAGSSEGPVRVECDEGNHYVYKVERAVERLVRYHEEKSSELYLRQNNRHCECGLGLLAIANQARTNRGFAGLGDVPRRTWLWMCRITHVWSSLIMNGDCPDC